MAEREDTGQNENKLMTISDQKNTTTGDGVIQKDARGYGEPISDPAN